MLNHSGDMINTDSDSLELELDPTQSDRKNKKRLYPIQDARFGSSSKHLDSPHPCLFISPFRQTVSSTPMPGLSSSTPKPCLSSSSRPLSSLSSSTRPLSSSSRPLSSLSLSSRASPSCLSPRPVLLGSGSGSPSSLSCSPSYNSGTPVYEHTSPVKASGISPGGIMNTSIIVYSPRTRFDKQFQAKIPAIKVFIPDSLNPISVLHSLPPI